MVSMNVYFVQAVLLHVHLIGGTQIDIWALQFFNKPTDGLLILEMNTLMKDLRELLKMSDLMTANKLVCAV